ncbi:ShlB/FhaC/HecB family hemolysin secretion/activation protein [Halopseudomonas nanhaiensis]|uniref:ShlB/FhaC/HecB family hemolysin secretion/activation protein n=1 Tax=Halopseudomonas nanhaiensis TaxID=2830842 RepID=UPI001CBDC000|nr:ShlB/FhaC/HecB family hemolysin secretion/activation protein [Halopseudomonas nanhaiensis]UAW97348.1 ShlB/FhaC/HecB family hemolysin secretion/activation protein [Halopseudomonas nanhaiensis]
MLGVMVGAELFGGSAWAQALPPGQVDPGLVRDQIEEQQRQRVIENRARRIEVPALRGEQPAEGDALPSESPEFELESISFNASTFLEKAELQAVAERYVGRPITFADLNELVRTINSQYSEAGQLTARAIIPPQSLENGILRIVLVESKVDGVQFSGERRVRDAFYRQRLQLEEGATLDSPMLIESIRRFNATTPGPQLSAGLAPGERFGTTRVDIEAFEPDPWAWSLFVNNYGNESTGREQYGGTLNWFSPTGVADNLGVMLVATRGTQYYNLRYSRPVNRSNGVAWVEAGANSLQIERGPLADLNIEGDSTNYGLGYDHPWQLSEKWLLLGGVAYTFQNSETTIEGVPLSEVDIQEAVLSGRFEYRAAPWYVRYEQRVRQAATDNKVTGDSGSFTLLDGDTYAARPLGERFELVGKLGWQYATKDDELPSALLKQFGGLSNMRGYDPGIIAAPWGAHVSLETHWNISKRWRPYVFLDYGRAMQLGSEDVDLASAGLGLNMQWGKHVSANLIAAAAMEEVVPDQDSGQAMLQIVIR